MSEPRGKNRRSGALDQRPVRLIFARGTVMDQAGIKPVAFCFFE
jgi:hypothetical protein